MTLEIKRDKEGFKVEMSFPLLPPMPAWVLEKMRKGALDPALKKITASRDQNERNAMIESPLEDTFQAISNYINKVFELAGSDPNFAQVGLERLQSLVEMDAKELPEIARYHGREGKD